MRIAGPQLGRSGLQGVRRHYTARLMAADTLAAYRRGLRRRAAEPVSNLRGKSRVCRPRSTILPR